MVTIFNKGKVEVWHAANAGDWAIAYFDLALPITPERVQKRFEETVRNWAKMQEAEGLEPTTKPHLNPNVYFCPIPGKGDERRFYIAARFKRVRPEKLPLDTAAELANAGDDNDSQIHQFFEQMEGFNTAKADVFAVERQAQENAGLPAKAEAERKELEEFDWKVNHRG